MGYIKKGFDFFCNNFSAFEGSNYGEAYVEKIETEISNFERNQNAFKGFNTPTKALKGDVAEFWHADTHNINAAARGTSERAFVDRSHDLGSADLTSNYGKSYGLKFYADGQSSAKAHATSVFQKFKEYQSSGGKDSVDIYLKKNGYNDIETILNDPLYKGQIRIIPSDQLEEATLWLEKMIKLESSRRPEQVERYKETLAMLQDRVKSNKGAESIPLTKEEAEKLAELAKQGKVKAEDFGLTTENLVNYEYIMQQSLKAGLSAATITLVLKVAPEIFKAVDYLIKNGEIDRKQLKQIGFAAISGSSEGFIRGSVAAAITIGCESGLLGAALKSIDPTMIGAVTAITMNVIKNSFDVVAGKKTRRDVAEELIRDMYVSACSLVLGTVAQGLIELPGLGFMIGSFIGSIIGSFTYNMGQKVVLSFCVDSGFTMFGLVEQDYTLPKEIMQEIGIDVFEYDSFEYDTFEYDSFDFENMDYETFEPETIDIKFLRRGVIGISKIGYI